MNIRRLLIILFISGAALLSAFPGLDVFTAPIDEENRNNLLEEGNISRSTDDGEPLAWLPNHPLAWKITGLADEMDPGLIVEIINFIPMEHNSREDIIVDIMNQFLAVSEQEGITYYSSSRKKDMVLIEESFAVKKAGSKKSVDDPTFSIFPDTRESYIYQKDSSFGGNYFLYRSQIYQDGAFMTSTNQSKMNVMGFFTVARPEENIMAYVLLPCEEGLYIYTAVLVKDPPSQERIMGVPIYIEGFFKKRVNKIVEWFASEFKL